MSFFMKLFNRRRQSRDGNVSSRVHTHEEGEFVHVSLSAPAKPEAEEEDADVSRWEMAQVLGRRPAAVGRRPATMSSLDAHKKAKRRDRKSVNVPRERTEELYCIEDSAELDMFDDKRNRIIKRSHRRKMNFPDKYKF